MATSEWAHGDIALVRQIGFSESSVARYTDYYEDDPEDKGFFACWAFFGTEVTLRFDQVEVLARMHSTVT